MIDPSTPPNGRSMQSFEDTSVRAVYDLVELVGEGTFGGVFRARQRFFDVPVRQVAVKLSKHVGMGPDQAREVFADAFLLAEAMDELADVRARSHLVHVYDSGLLPHDGRGYLAMEYVDGTSLDTQLRSLERVPARQLVTWVSQACLALRGLHALPTPVVHRDLKPANVLLGTDLAVRLVDFGLSARLLDQGYVPGVVGTVAYMAPETSQGWSVPASDVYSMGLILYEGLTGQLPFADLVPPLDLPEALHAEWLFEQKKGMRVLPPSQRSNTTTPQLDAVVLSCLEFEPSGRYRDAGELLAALETLDAPAAETPAVRARRLRQDGDLAGARNVLERALDASSTSASVDQRFALLRQLGDVLMEQDEPAAGADRLCQAWELARGAAVLRSRAQRAELLEEIAAAFEAAGNRWQANRYRQMAQDERG